MTGLGKSSPRHQTVWRSRDGFDDVIEVPGFGMAALAGNHTNFFHG